MLGVAPGLFGNHWEWVSGSLEGVMQVPLHELVALLCSAYRVFSCSLPLLGSPPFSPLFFHSLKVLLLFFQFRVTCTGAGAGFSRQVGLMAELQVGQALRCSSYLVLGSAVPAPMFLGTRLPYATKAPDLLMQRSHIVKLVIKWVPKFTSCFI